MGTLEERLQHAGGAIQMMRSTPPTRFWFQYPNEHDGWLDEQWAWQNTAVLFNQSFHMDDVTFTGPDASKLLSDTGINSFTTFGRDKAKQFVAVNQEGYVIGDAILFGMEDDAYSLVGAPVVANWVMYQASIGNYDVEIIQDPRAEDLRDRRQYRYQVTGPQTQNIMEKAQGAELEQIKFFNMGELTIAGKKVRALNHGMAKVPGQVHGLELMGPAEDAEVVLNTILEAGQEFGLRRGGAQAYASTLAESGWLAAPLPAIYTGEHMKAYREWLPAESMEGLCGLVGSFTSDNIEDYYSTPWDLGYGHLVKFDHDFIGRDALEAMAEQPHRRKVWMEWNSDDVQRIIGEALFGTGDKPQLIDMPTSLSVWHYDAVTVNGNLVGLSSYSAYTVNNGCYVSIGSVDESVEDGTEVIVHWGESDGGQSQPHVHPHVQTQIRAALRTKSPAE